MNKSYNTSIGIDISKKTLDIAIISECKKKHNKVTNDMKGYKLILKEITELDLSKDISVIIEATGGYHYGIVYYLLDNNFSNVKVINPSIAKAFIQMNDIRSTKTDKVDAIMLAKLGQIKNLPSYTQTKEDVERKNIVTTLIGLRKSLREQTQRKNNFEYQEELGINCKEILKTYKSVIRSLQVEIKKLEKRICNLSEEDVKIISSIKGISQKGAAVISSQLGDISRLKNSKQVIGFSGLSPRVKSSGTSVKGQGRISKRGDAVLRESLFQSAWYICMQAGKGLADKVFQDFIDRLKKKNLHYFQIMCAVAHKLLGIIYSLLKKQEMYNSKFFENNLVKN
jgi:transposase